MAASSTQHLDGGAGGLDVFQLVAAGGHLAQRDLNLLLVAAAPACSKNLFHAMCNVLRATVVEPVPACRGPPFCGPGMHSAMLRVAMVHARHLLWRRRGHDVGRRSSGRSHDCAAHVPEARGRAQAVGCKTQRCHPQAGEGHQPCTAAHANEAAALLGDCESCCSPTVRACLQFGRRSTETSGISQMTGRAVGAWGVFDAERQTCNQLDLTWWCISVAWN